MPWAFKILCTRPLPNPLTCPSLPVRKVSGSTGRPFSAASRVIWSITASWPLLLKEFLSRNSVRRFSREVIANSRQRRKKVFCQVRGDRSGYRIAHCLVSIIKCAGKPECFRCAHKPCRLAGAKNARSPFVLALDHKILPTATTCRGTQTSRNVVETEFKNLLLVPDTLIPRNYRKPAVSELSHMSRRNHRQILFASCRILAG